MSFAHEFHTFVTTHSNEKPTDSIAASGSPRKHYGLSNPSMRSFVKQWVNHHPNLSYAEWETTLSELYRSDSIDERCLAGFILGPYRRFREELPLTRLSEWIEDLTGWREIDTTCQSNFSALEVLGNWNEWEPMLRSHAISPNISLRRASLVLLVKALRESNDPQLIETALFNVKHLENEPNKLITKAISWVLRSAIRQHGDTVAAFVDHREATLPAIAVREFWKKYETGKK